MFIYPQSKKKSLIGMECRCLEKQLKMSSMKKLKKSTLYHISIRILTDTGLTLEKAMKAEF